MLKKRIIAVILLRNGVIVQSRKFKRYQILGSPTAAVERLNSWACDELIYLDISTTPHYGLNRGDLIHHEFEKIKDIVGQVAKKCFMPLSFGGGIRSLEDISMRVKNGADKVTINSMALENPEIIKDASIEFGSQCLVISMDVKKSENGGYEVYKRGKEATGLSALEFALKVERWGAGEILLNSVDNDGQGNGFDIELINLIASKVKIPVIAMGGAGSEKHFEEVLLKTKVSGVAAANYFQHSENSMYNLKKHLYDRNFNVRKPLELSNEKSLL